MLDAGLVSLSVVARFHGKAADPEQLRHALALGEPAQTADLLLAAKRLGLKAKIGGWIASELRTRRFPASARLRAGSLSLPGSTVRRRSSTIP